MRFLLPFAIFAILFALVASNENGEVHDMQHNPLLRNEPRCNADFQMCERHDDCCSNRCITLPYLKRCLPNRPPENYEDSKVKSNQQNKESYRKNLLPPFVAVKECQPIGGYCLLHEECCSKLCAFYLAKCVWNRPPY